MALGGISLLFMGLLLLIGLTLPDLRREVTPPEISGVEQIARVDNTRETPRLDDAPTSKKAALDLSGQVVLNLDDFPHLSPAMRREMETWIKTWNTRIVPDTLVIKDPVLRNQNWEVLSRYVEVIRSYLNLPLEWGKISNATVVAREDTYSPERNRVAGIGYPDDGGLQERMRFERAVCYEDWAEAVGFKDTGVTAETVGPDGMRYCGNFGWHDMGDAGVLAKVVPTVDQDTWNERMYCWRQMGIAGQLGQVANSYERSLRTQIRNGKAVYVLSLPSGFVWDVSHDVWKVWGKPPKNPTPPEPPASE
jgi:hypothetical protein